MMGYRVYSTERGPQSLVAGTQYFMKVLHTESYGADHLSVAMLEPGSYVWVSVPDNTVPIRAVASSGHVSLTTEFVVDSCCFPACLDPATRDEDLCDATPTCNSVVPMRNPSRCGWDEVTCSAPAPVPPPR